jgi:hypothetical protein
MTAIGREACPPCPKTDLELNRSAHHWDEGNRLLSPENGISSAIEVVE